MTTRRCLCALAGVFAFAWLSPMRGETSGPQLISQTPAVTLDCPGDISHGHWKWSHSAFVYALMAGGLSPTFYTLDREGKFVSSATPQIPDVTGVSLLDSDRATDGSIVYSGWSASAYGEVQPFLIYLSPEGQTTHIIPTAPYWPYMLAIAPDGTVWTIGEEMINHDPKDPELNTGAGVLRHFDRTGKLIASGIPKSSFTTGHQSSRLIHGFLVAMPNRLAWYTPKYNLLQRRSEYIEISPGSLQLQSYPGLPPPAKNGFYVGFAVTDAGDVFVSYEDHTNPLPRPSNYHLRTLYTFDRSTSKWALVPVPPFGKYPDPLLIGAEGDQLVFKNGYSAAFFQVSPSQQTGKPSMSTAPRGALGVLSQLP